MKTIYAFLSILIISSMASPLKAQEKQVPIFPEQEIMTINRSYAKKMSFFTGYNNFVEAKLFLTPENSYALEIFYEVNDSLFKDRKLLTSAEKDEYLENLLQQYAEQFDETTESGTTAGDGTTAAGIQLLNQKGRPAMLVMNTIGGLGYYGYALPLALRVEDEKAVVGLYMLASGASFYLPYRITQRKDVTMAQASLNFYGISRGVMHGMFLGELFSKDPFFDDYYDPYSQGESWNEQEYKQAEEEFRAAQDRRQTVLFGMGMVGSITGGVAGFNLAKHWEYDIGSTSIFQMWGDLGTISGLLFADVFDFYSRRELNAAFGTTIATSFMGMTGGKFFGDTRNYTLGDAIVFRSTVALSALPLITLVDYFNPEDETAYTVAGLASIAAGGYLGWKATLNRDFTTSDGVFVALGELAGGLLGLGIGYLVAPDFESEILLTSATLGALGGYGLMYSGLKKNALLLNNRMNLDMHLNPMGLLLNKLNQPFTPAMAGMYSIAHLNMRF
jgi:hypothetical protein